MKCTSTFCIPFFCDLVHTLLWDTHYSGKVLIPIGVDRYLSWENVVHVYIHIGTNKYISKLLTYLYLQWMVVDAYHTGIYKTCATRIHTA